MGLLKLIENFESELNQKDLQFLLSMQKIDTSLTVKTIESIETSIMRQWGKEPHKPMPTTVLLFGILFSKSLMNEFPGKLSWGEDSQNMADMIMTAKTEGGVVMQVAPFIRVAKFFKERDDSLMGFYEMLKFSFENDIHSPEFIKEHADADGWITLPNGSKLRMRQFDINANVVSFTVPIEDFIDHVLEDTDMLSKKYEIAILLQSRTYEISGEWEKTEKFCSDYSLLKFLPELKK